MVYLFDEYVLDTSKHELRKAGTLVLLQPIAYRVLVHLIRNRDRMVSKPELLERCWPSRFVTDAVIKNCIMKLRRTLGDLPPSTRYIRTLRSWGYRFEGDVSEQEGGPLDQLGKTASVGQSDLSPPQNPAALATIAAHSSRSQKSVSDPLSLGSVPGKDADKQFREVTVLSCVARTDCTRSSAPLSEMHPLQPFYHWTGATDSDHEHFRFQHTKSGLAMVFGIGQDQTEHSIRAVHTALRLQCWMHNIRRFEDYYIPCSSYGLGIHTGSIAVVSTLDPSPILEASGEEVFMTADELALRATGEAPLASEATLHRASGRFYVGGLKLLLVGHTPKGISAYPVLGAVASC